MESRTKQIVGKLTKDPNGKCRDGSSSNSTTSIQQLNPWQRREVPAANGKITAYVYSWCFYSMLHIVRWPLYHRTSNVPMRPHDPRRNPRVFYTIRKTCLFQNKLQHTTTVKKYTGRSRLDKGTSHGEVRSREETLVSVSYTHLTLPTIYSV